MSTELKSLRSGRHPEVNVTAFFGGTVRGSCLQLTQSPYPKKPGDFVGYIQLTREQVVQARAVMADWLEDHK